MSRLNAAVEKSLRLLLQYKAPFGGYFEEWIKSEDCPISVEEAELMDCYARYGNHQFYSEKTGRPISNVRNAYSKAVSKLQTARSIHHFKRWYMLRQLRKTNLDISSNSEVGFYNIPSATILLSLSAFLKIVDLFSHKTPMILTDEDLRDLEAIKTLKVREFSERVKESLLIELRLLVDD